MAAQESLESLQHSFNRSLRVQGKADRTPVLYGQSLVYFSRWLAEQDLPDFIRALASCTRRAFSASLVRSVGLRPHPLVAAVGRPAPGADPEKENTTDDRQRHHQSVNPSAPAGGPKEPKLRSSQSPCESRPLPLPRESRPS
jgi:hypothetical protein